jgi:hypothetical protein
VQHLGCHAAVADIPGTQHAVVGAVGVGEDGALPRPGARGDRRRTGRGAGAQHQWARVAGERADELLPPLRHEREEASAQPHVSIKELQRQLAAAKRIAAEAALLIKADEEEA